MNKKVLAICASILLSVSLNAIADNLTWPSSKVGKIEVGFSPEGTAEQLVIKVIDAAQKDVKVLAYSFTSPVIVKALINAKRRGAKVAVAADASNLKSKPGQAALSALVTSGVEVRTVDAFKILHDKLILVDGRHVQSGSFNYSKAASKSNSENATVMWDAPDVTAAYTKHWKSRWDQGAAFTPRY